jgi:hypothetical protein
MAKELNRRSFYNKKTDKEEVRFYSGRRKATKEELKAAMRADLDQFNPDYLTAQDRQLLGRIKGGLTRSSQAVRIQGEFVSKRFLKERKFDDMAKAKGYNTTKSMFDHEPQIFENANRQYQSKDGLKVGEVTNQELVKLIDTFSGRIFVSGEEKDKMSAIFEVQNFFSYCVREMEAYLVQFDVTYRKGNQMHFSIPSYDEGKPEDAEKSINEWENLGIDVKIKSDAGKPEDPPSPEEDPDRYTYEITEIKKNKKGGHYKKKSRIKAHDVGAAMRKVTQEKNRAIISVNRIFNEKNGGKKN